MTCERKGKWIRGCRFEARYDLREPAVPLSPFGTFSLSGTSSAIVEASTRKRTYVHDVCVTCGETRARPPA